MLTSELMRYFQLPSKPVHKRVPAAQFYQLPNRQVPRWSIFYKDSLCSLKLKQFTFILVGCTNLGDNIVEPQVLSLHTQSFNFANKCSNFRISELIYLSFKEYSCDTRQVRQISFKNFQIIKSCTSYRSLFSCTLFSKAVLYPRPLFLSFFSPFQQPLLVALYV